MYLSTITLKNFRKYAYDGVSKHGMRKKIWPDIDVRKKQQKENLNI